MMAAGGEPRMQHSFPYIKAVLLLYLTQSIPLRYKEDALEMGAIFRLAFLESLNFQFATSLQAFLALILLALFGI